jgi:maltose O-acetyltransferase
MMNFIGQRLKEILYRLRAEYTTEKLTRMGMRVGHNFNRLHGVILDPSHCWLISIGDNVTMAPRVHVLAHDASTKLVLGFTKIGRVNIGNNVFVGADSVILPNVTIGDNVVIGANSTVSKSIPSNCVVAGSPAKWICNVQEFVDKNKGIMAQRPCYDESYTTRANVDMKKKQQMIDELRDGVGFVM